MRWHRGYTPGHLQPRPDSLRRKKRCAAQPGDAATSAAAKTGLAYSITYPFGVVAPMLVIVALDSFLECALKSKSTLVAEDEKQHPRIEIEDIEVTAAVHAGKSLKEHPLLRGNGIVFTRLLRGNIRWFQEPTRLWKLAALSRDRASDQSVQSHCGDRPPKRNKFDLRRVTFRRMDLVVTNTQVLHRSLQELDLVRRTGVTIGQINRGINLIPTGSLRLAFADQVTVAGPKVGLQLVEAEFGNVHQKINQSQLVPFSWYRSRRDRRQHSIDVARSAQFTSNWPVGWIVAGSPRPFAAG